MLMPTTRRLLRRYGNAFSRYTNRRFAPTQPIRGMLSLAVVYRVKRMDNRKTRPTA